MTVLDRLSAALAGRYRIERELGAGGMATVYLAHDERHDRKVAIKVLHEDLGATLGPERFLTEIKTTAKLQHPHILPLLDSGAAGGLLFYVMPYVEGESLRDRLEREKQLPIDDAVRIAREIADALGVAHAAGIVHRDIKPENILLQGGHALVADFGIALAVQQAGGSRLTQTGLSLGTPQYMAPEQAMGEKGVDARADLYALGAVTYEMLVGEPPFTGATVQAIVAKVISSDPEPPTTMRKTIPEHVEAAVLMALAKLPADRQATVTAFAAALGGTISGAGDARVISGARRAASNAGRVRAWAVVGVTIGVFAGFAMAWFALRGGAGAARASGVTRAYLLQPAGEALPGGTDDFALSPDGDVLVYVGPGELPGSRALWRKRRSELHATRIAGTAGALGPFISPDGKWIGYTSGSALMRVPVNGGDPVTVSSEMVGTLGYGAWLDDGRIVSGGRSWLGVVGRDGGKVDTIGDAGRFRGYNPVNVVALPGSKTVLVQVCPPACARSTLYAVDLRTKVATLVLEEVRFPSLLPGGRLAWTTASGDLTVADVDAATGKLTSTPRRVAERVAVFTASVSGDLVYKEGTPGLLASPTIVDRSGRYTPIDSAWRAWITSGAVSPDGKRLAVSILADGEQQIWLKELPNGPLSKLTLGRGDHFRPSWSADGTSIYYVFGLEGRFTVMLQKADGTGKPQPIPAGNHDIADITESRDGRYLAMRTTGGDTTRGFIVIDRSRDTVPRIVDAGPGYKLGLTLSPDAKFIAYQSLLTGRPEIYVSPFPEVASARWQVSRDGGVEPRWASNGHELFFVSLNDELVSASYVTAPSFRVTGVSKVLDLVGYLRDSGWHTFDPLKGDNAFLMLRRDLAQGPLVLVTNWLSELRSPAGGR